MTGRWSWNTRRLRTPAVISATRPMSPAAACTSSSSKFTVCILRHLQLEHLLVRTHLLSSHHYIKLKSCFWAQLCSVLVLQNCYEFGIELFLFSVPPRFVREDGSGEVYEDDLNNRIPEQASVLSGENIRLACPVDAIPPPQITWYKNGQELRIEELDKRFVTLFPCHLWKRSQGLSDETDSLSDVCYLRGQ